MTDLQVVEPHAAAAAGTPALRAPVSRRRVLHGIAWGTPAILIATASPPAAASVTVTPGGTATLPGGLLAPSATANQNISVLTVTTYLQYDGGTAVQGYQPFTSILRRIWVPAGRANGTTATTTSAGWSPTATSVLDGGFRVFTFTYTGTPLGPGYTTPAPLVAVIPKTSETTPFTIRTSAEGVSAGQSMTIGPHDLAVGAFSTLAIQWSSPYTAGTNSGSTVVAGGVLNGINAGNTAPVVNLVARISVPTNSTTGGTAPASLNSAWTYQGVTTSGGFNTYLFQYTPGTLNPSYTQTDYVFRIPRAHGSLPTTYTLVIEGRSPNANGALSSVSQTVTLSN